MSEVARYVKGADPDRDAWLTNFFTENHLAYETFPDVVASPEQLKFIVHLEDEQIYYPCSDELFSAIIEKRADTMLTSAYIGIWTRLEKLVREVITGVRCAKPLIRSDAAVTSSKVGSVSMVFILLKESGYQGQSTSVPIPVACACRSNKRATVRSCKAMPVMSKTVMSSDCRANAAFPVSKSPSVVHGVSGAHWASPISRDCVTSSQNSRTRLSSPSGISRFPSVSAPTQLRCVPGWTASKLKSAPVPGVAVITMSLAATAESRSVAWVTAQSMAVASISIPASNRASGSPLMLTY